LVPDGIISIEVDENFCTKKSAIELAYQSAVAKGREVIAVVGSAPSTSTGNYDDLEALGKFANDNRDYGFISTQHMEDLRFSLRNTNTF
jgi:L-2,4-diaminobutyrate decarboxylase